MSYKLAIFDMDGTILNTLEDLCDSMNYCLGRFDMPTRSLEEVRGFVGNGIRRAIEQAVVPGTDDAIIDSMFDTFTAYYKEHCAIKTRPYDGIKECIMALRNRGVKTAVVSNKIDSAVKSLCDDYFSGLFDYSVGDKEGQRRKPYPDSVNEVISHFSMDKADVVYIGDSDVDYMTARNAQIDVIMVSWGFRDEDFILSLGAPFVLHAPSEIQDRILL